MGWALLPAGPARRGASSTCARVRAQRPDAEIARAPGRGAVGDGRAARSAQDVWQSQLQADEPDNPMLLERAPPRALA
ncbi:MAG: hypothetical protein MZW92_69040 [Comamonadaceae bacterium]|nr:hypothetical protein [Comamonadaceae bacterium]